MFSRKYTSALVLFLYVGCVDSSREDGIELNVATQDISLAAYSASSTSSATNVNTTAQIPVSFAAGETIMIGTQGITGSSFTGDTYLRLRNASQMDLATGDDACGTLGSRLSFTSPTAATFTVWAGCFGSDSCGSPNPNIVAISHRNLSFAFSASNTNNASLNTINKQVFLNGGNTVRVSTCSGEASGGSASGDTYLRLYANNGGVLTQVASNDNAETCSCGTSSLILFSVSSSGFYQINAGCALNTSCSGTVVIYSE